MILKDKQTGAEEAFLARLVLEWNRDGALPSWIQAWREEGWERLQETGFPTRKAEEWKYVPLKALFESPFRRATQNIPCEHKAFEKFASEFDVELVFVNGVFSPEHSKGVGETDGISLLPWSRALQMKEKEIRTFLDRFQGKSEDAFTFLNQAFLKEGAILFIPQKTRFEKTIHVVHLSTDAEFPVFHCPRTCIYLGANAEASVLESFVSFSGETHFTNAVTDVILETGASLEHCKIQSESKNAFHVGAMRALLEKDSRLHSFSFSVGAKLARNNLHVDLNGEGASVSLDGLYAGKGSQFLDNHTRVDHLKPHGTSRQLYKGVLNDKARAVFNGKIKVHPGAQQTDSVQLNRNLLLSKESHVDTKPELQISADDVQCKHGATIGQLNEDEIFYFQSRGVPRKKAVHMLIHGFVDDVILRLKSEVLRKKLNDLLLDFYSGVEGDDCRLES